MELQGNLNLERSPSRRWVSIVAVVVPVVAFVSLGAWFVRAYVMPPTITIPSPTLLAAAPPVRAAVEQPRPEPPSPATAPMSEPDSLPSAAEPQIPTAALPMFATLAAAPPAFESTLPAYADPAQDNTTNAIATDTSTAALESSEPITGPIPMPRRKPSPSLALAGGPVPLPKPRPTDEAPPRDLPVFDRHAVE